MDMDLRYETLDVPYSSLELYIYSYLNASIGSRLAAFHAG